MSARSQRFWSETNRATQPRCEDCICDSPSTLTIRTRVPDSSAKPAF